MFTRLNLVALVLCFFLPQVAHAQPLLPEVMASHEGLLIHFDSGDQLQLDTKQLELLGIQDNQSGPYLTRSRRLEADGCSVVVLEQPRGATAIYQMSQFWIATLDSNGTKDLREQELYSDIGVETSFLHGAFVGLHYTKTDYEENEAGAMEVSGEPVGFHDYFVIDECNVLPLAEVPREKLRFFRNRVFARYGYQFKSEDLTAYFSQFAWYDPTTTDVNAQVTEADKRLIATIRALE
jgi:hypothetical protein